MKTLKALSEASIFIRRWWAHPMQLGSLLPSSRFLSAFIAREALKRIDEDEYILELGAGTGRFTKALLAQGIDPRRILAIEIDPRLIHYLHSQFPDVQVIQGNACHLTQLVLPHLQGRRIGVIISGLPMLGFSRAIQKDIVDNCFSVLKEKGALLQFTYGLSSSLNASHLGIQKKRLGWVLRNVPPACVWSYEKDVV